MLGSTWDSLGLSVLILLWGVLTQFPKLEFNAVLSQTKNLITCVGKELSTHHLMSCSAKIQGPLVPYVFVPSVRQALGGDLT